MGPGVAGPLVAMAGDQKAIPFSLLIIKDDSG
jgi:hypothetical protein